MVNFYVFPMLNTSNLRLRKLDHDDIPLLVKYADNRKISDRIINIPYPYREPDAVFRLSYALKGFKERSRFVFVMALKETNEFIGEISLHIEEGEKAQLGYWVGEPFWRNGYAKEAIEAITKFGFEQLKMNKIYALCHADNIGSQKAVERNAFEKVSVTGRVILFKRNK